MGKIKGNKTLSGTWGELWVDGERIAEFSKVSLKVTANREDVQIDLDVDSKMTGLKGELSVTLKKVYTRYNAVFENWKKGIDQRMQIITKLAGHPSTVTDEFLRFVLIWASLIGSA